MNKTQAREAIARLAPGAIVGHANRQLADWAGVIEANRKDQWWTLEFGGDVRVRWTAGLDGYGNPLAGKSADMIAATAVTLKGECPDCGRPAHYIFAGNDFDRTEGWCHDSRHDAGTCWAGKAKFETDQAARLQRIRQEAAERTGDGTSTYRGFLGGELNLGRYAG